MLKGKTPSLIGGSLGRPVTTTAGKRSPCSRCDVDILMGEQCYDVPRPAKKFRNTRRFCSACFKAVLGQTRRDLEQLEAPPYTNIEALGVPEELTQPLELGTSQERP